MKGTSLVVVLLAVAAAGCRSSTRSIELTDGTLAIEDPQHFEGIAAYAFSKDGTKMISFVGGAGDTTDYEIRDTSTGVVLASYSSEESMWMPLMFTRDDSAVVFARGEAGRMVTAIVPVGSEPPKEATVELVSGVPVELPNNDWSLWVGSHGQVITDAGKTLRVEGVAEHDAFAFDQYGNAWYRMQDGGWTRVDKQGDAQRLPKPSYLTQEVWMRRGSLRLVAKNEEMKYEHATAFVTAVWLHSGRAKGGFLREGEPRNLSALVHVGADVLWAAFVPNQDKVLIVDSNGTWLVPYDVKTD